MQEVRSGCDAVGRVVESEPLNAEAHYRLALLLTKTGKAEEAKQHFNAFEHLLKR